ncbi:MAG: tRNA (adenosine(37)-N6)-threonylcarbamoyltransferase complex dimerization subunit type 1 TsaB [Chthoniobacterales bacterium]
MKVLALELSSTRGSVALLQHGNEVLVREFPNDRHDSAAFFEAVAEMSQNNSGLDSIVVGLGPGSYAGTRIAISTATGLRFATGATLVGLPSICAFDVPDREYCAVGDARRKSFWIAMIRDAVCVEMPQLVNESELRARLGALHARAYSSESLPQFASVVPAFPSARRLARISFSDHPNIAPSPLQPLYLREAHITVSKQPVWKHAS